MKEDKELVKEVLSGNIAAFEEIMRRYESGIMRFCFSMVGCVESAEDITQEVFVKVYNKLYTYKSDYKFSTWLYQISKNKCIDYIRRNRKTSQISLSSLADLSDSSSPQEAVEFNETKKLIINFIGSLKEIDRQILLLRYVNEHLTFKDIAEIMNISEANAKKRYYRAYEKYETFLEREYKTELKAVCKG